MGTTEASRSLHAPPSPPALPEVLLPPEPVLLDEEVEPTEPVAEELLLVLEAWVALDDVDDALAPRELAVPVPADVAADEAVAPPEDEVREITPEPLHAAATETKPIQTQRMRRPFS